MSDLPPPDAAHDATEAATEATTATPPGRLGERLKAARERAGLELSVVAQRTHVRRAYLEALEEGRYGELPEDVYARNFVRLHAQTVGLDPAPLLELYAQERQAALGRSTLERRLDHDRRDAAALGHGERPARARTAGRARPGALPSWIGPGVATIALVAVVVGLAAWGFDRLFAAPTATPTASGPAAAGVAAADAADGATAGSVEGATAGDDASGLAAATATEAAAPVSGPGEGIDAIVRVDLVTDPPGASLTVDGFAVPGRTPLADVPFTARAARVVRAELEGYAPAERVVDLLEDQVVELTLTPLAPAADEAAVASDGALTLTIVDATWLEVYTGDARNEGERLVYTTAQPGDRYDLDVPVYVYVGNAAGVRVTLRGQDLGAMGAPGAVLGRPFGP
jgi:cytoskeleton protein RodZ